jgi:hypothetical protein
MKLFRKFFRKPSQPKRDDSVFGPIEFESNHGIDMWIHSPSGVDDPIIVLFAPESGPTQGQRDLYRSLKDRFPKLEAACKEFIGQQEDAPEDVSALKIYAVEIGPDEEIAEGRFTIELADAEADEINRVEFIEGKPAIYGVDD